MANDASRTKRVEQAQLRVLFNVPFFAPGVARLPIVWDDGIPTACTDGQRIRWNREWFDHCKEQELVTVLCEEVGHCLLGHLWRAPSGADHTTWNMACDQAVRLMMKEFGELVTAKKLANPFPFPDPEQLAPSDCYRGMPEEQIYNLLSQNSGQPKQPPGSGKPGKGGSGQSGGAGKPGPQKGKPGSTGQSGQSGSKPAPNPFAEFEPAKADPAGKKLSSDWNNTLIQAVEASKGRGDVPGGMLRLVDGILNPRVPWTELLRRWLREQCDDDWNWMKPNLQFEGSGFILPSLDSERAGAVVFATDTSGSIDQDMLAMFHVEKQNCLDDMKPAKLVDICCDARITSEQEYRPGDEIDRKAPGGGGTDFRPVFERALELQPPPKCLVYLTDLQGSFPDTEAPFPVLWVTWDKGGKAPFGEVVHADS